MDATKKPLQHKPTDDLISNSLEVAAKIRDQELAVKALREELEGRWDDHRGESTPGINDDVAETEKVVARMERDLLAQKEFLARKLRAQVDTNISGTRSPKHGWPVTAMGLSGPTSMHRDHCSGSSLMSSTRFGSPMTIPIGPGCGTTRSTSTSGSTSDSTGTPSGLVPVGSPSRDSLGRVGPCPTRP